MRRLWDQIRYRAKAIIGAAGIAFVGLAEYVVQDPATARVLEQFVPAPYAQLVPVVLGAVSVVLLHEVPNGRRPGTRVAASAAPALPELVPAAAPGPLASPAPREPAPVTSMVQLVQAPGGGN